MKKTFPFFIISVCIIIIDQVSKHIIRATMKMHESLPVWGDLFRITRTKNTGAAFSLSFGSQEINRIIFTVISSAAIFLLIYWIIKAENKTESFIYSMILGGAIGNLIDRVLRGGVTDFLDVDFPDFIMSRWPIFNIADSAIVIAVIIFGLFTISRKKNIL